MTLQVVGALCILIVLVGEGVKISGVEVPRLSRRRAAALTLAGVLFVALGLLPGVELS
ncbi:hypothetical protein ACWCOZ_32120 [Streptomyces sp. NPDC001840]